MIVAPQAGPNPGSASVTPSIYVAPTTGIGTTTASTPANQSAVSVMLALGLELLMLGIATGLANTSEEVGKIILVLMIGFLILFMMYHTTVVQTIPALFNLLQQGKL